jgi:hypothetical protein
MTSLSIRYPKGGPVELLPLQAAAALLLNVTDCMSYIVAVVAARATSKV